jgi:hypothetical protein
MKALFFAALLAVTGSSLAFADAKSDNLLASTLTNPQVQSEVAEFGKLVNWVHSVKMESILDVDTITLEGNVIRSGDIVCGVASLKITRTFELGFGRSTLTNYKAELTKNLVPIESCNN